MNMDDTKLLLTVKVDCARGVVAAIEDDDACGRRCAAAARTATSARVHGALLTNGPIDHYNPLL